MYVVYVKESCVKGLCVKELCMNVCVGKLVCGRVVCGSLCVCVFESVRERDVCNKVVFERAVC